MSAGRRLPPRTGSPRAQTLHSKNSPLLTASASPTNASPRPLSFQGSSSRTWGWTGLSTITYRAPFMSLRPFTCKVQIQNYVQPQACPRGPIRKYV